MKTKPAGTGLPVDHRWREPAQTICGHIGADLGVLQVAAQHGLRVPGDLAVVGFDDIPESAYLVPALTTVHQSTTELGAAAVRMLTGLIEGRQGPAAAQMPEPVWLQPRLVVRQSSLRRDG